MKNWLSGLILLLVISSCDSDSPMGPGDNDTEPPYVPVSCEASEVYDWSDSSFTRTMDELDTLWMSFTTDSLAIYTISFDAVGFEGLIYDQCDPDSLAVGDSTLTGFTTIGLGELPLGIVSPDDYYLRLVNTRNRSEFNMTINIIGLVYGCMDQRAINYDSEVNWPLEGACIYQDCTTEHWVDNYGECGLDCEGNCYPLSWIGDDWCDSGDWGVYNEDGEITPIYLWCEELDWDGGDCEEIDEGCPSGTLEDCNGNCAPEGWLSDTFCDDGSYEYGGNYIFFNCEEFNNDVGDCDSLGRQLQQRMYPNGRILID